MQDTRGRFIAIVIVSLFLGYVAAPIKNKWPPFLAKAQLVLGIDLAGGAEMTYRLLYEPGKNYPEKSKVGEQVVSVLQNRILNRQGLKEPRITTQGEDFIIIQLPGADRDALDDYKKLIGDVGNLELKMVAGKEVHEAFNASGSVEVGYEKYPAPEMGDSRTVYPWIQQWMIVKKEPVITGQDIQHADHEQDLRRATGGGLAVAWKVNFTLKDVGSKKFDEAARELFNRSPKGHIAIIIDNQLKSAPVVQAEAFKGSGEITGGFDEDEAKNLAIVLRSGSLPVAIGKIADGKMLPKVPEAENFVGPSLGQDAINRGLFASGATLAGIMLFMIVYYRAGGVIAVITIILNLTYLMAAMSFFNATLTLPGIAGIALTLGMAVDANILIYERMREELDKGKTLSQAYEAGHERAFVTIVDSNLTTLLAGLVLYFFGTGPVKGFAVTLSIGIITTLVSVLVCGKTMLEMLIMRGSLQKMTMMRAMSSPKYDWVKGMRPAILASLLIVVGLMTVFVIRGERNFGIDFRGGSMVNFAFVNTQKIENVRTRVHGILDAKTGQKKYHDADIQTIAEPGQGLKDINIRTGNSRQFQLRSRTQDLDGLRLDLQKEFEKELSHQPLVALEKQDVPGGSRYFESGEAGGGWWVYLRDDGKFNLAETEKKIQDGLAHLLSKDSQGVPEVKVIQSVEGVPAGLVRLKLVMSQRDMLLEGGQKHRLVRDALKTMGTNGALALSADPFAATGKIGATVAQELKHSSIWAMVFAWGLMIAYIAVRFSSWRFGVAAVIALVHDCLIAIGIMSLLGAVVPAAWGLSFDMNMTFVAAILTVIGYSINDKIVIFDRVREDLGIMKKETFPEIVNAAVNQTLSRTILTGTCVLLSGIVLYIATATSGGGIAEFSLPLVVGTVAGTYSSIFVAMPIVLWWYGKTKPQIV